MSEEEKINSLKSVIKRGKPVEEEVLFVNELDLDNLPTEVPITPPPEGRKIIQSMATTNNRPGNYPGKSEKSEE